MVPDHIGVCGTAVAEHARGAIGWGATQQERNGTKDAQARGVERYLPLKAGRLTSADDTPQEEPSRVGDFKRLLMWDGPAMGRLCAHRCTCSTCACAGETEGHI
jgi:hypothetical protein